MRTEYLFVIKCLQQIKMKIMLKQSWFYIMNHIIAHIPSYFIRKQFYLLTGVKIGKNSSIKLNSYISGKKLTIGNNTSIGRNSFLDGRGGIVIGNNVSISPDVQLITGSHDVNSDDFKYITKSIIIEDFVWIGTRAIILPGVTVKKGAVISAGSIVTKDVDELSIVAGSPAKRIGHRKSSLNYSINWNPIFN